MAGRGKKIFTLPVIAAFLFVSLPLLITLSRDDNRPDLTGIVISDEKPELKRASWFSGEYQEERNSYNDDHWAFKESMVRLNNQLYYDAFNQIRVKGFVSGKQNYVFSENYIFSAFGDDLLPETEVMTLLDKAKVIQDTLKSKGIDLLLVIAPGKGMGCREYVEDKYVHPVTTTNYDLYSKHCVRRGLNLLDLNSYFLGQKNKLPYPLFPPFGHHWSYYCECLAVDTIIRHIEHLHHADMPNVHWLSTELSDTARHRDADILKSMNLWRDPGQNIKLAYPRIQVEDDNSKNTTRVLTIGDSYWYGPVYMGVPQDCFAYGEFWYYFNRVVPSRQGQKVEVWELDLRTEIEKNDVVMLLYSDGNLPTFGSGFIEEVYHMYTSPESYRVWNQRRKQLNVFAKQVRESPILLKKATRKSEELRISVDSAITIEALRISGITSN